MKLPPEYFINRVRVIELKTALVKAIPPMSYYHEINVALAEVLAEMVASEYKDEMMGKRSGRKTKDTGGEP